MEYAREFAKNEDGVETFEYVMMIGVAAALIGVIAAIFFKSKDTAEKTGSTLSRVLDVK